MTKAERIARLKSTLQHERKAYRECAGNRFATAEEQRLAVTGIVTSIERELRRLGAA